MRFRSRQDAGRRLAAKLDGICDCSEAIVYALPRGGVALGVEVARRLRIPLDLLIARKIGHPHNPAHAIGAVTETGDAVFDRREVARVVSDWFRDEIARAHQEARRRRERYSGGRPPLACTGKTAILIDDAIATGYTMEAAIRDAQGQRPARLVVAVPVISVDIAERFRRDVDDVVALDVTPGRFNVGSVHYDDFPRLSDDDVVSLLRELNAGSPGTCDQ